MNWPSPSGQSPALADTLLKHNLRTLLGALLLGAGVLAFQIHRSPAMKGHIKDVLLKELPEGGVVAFDRAALPASAAPAEKANGQPKRKAKLQPKAGAPSIEWTVLAGA